MNTNNFNINDINNMNFTDFELYYAMVVKRINKEQEK